MPEDGRPDPDALIAEAGGDGRGWLKIFLGAAPGVGKTWEMLSQARRRRAEGVDVLCGVVETHGRAGTIAELADLKLLPLRQVEYRGQTLAEFDADAALAARPGLLLVDELAHTNAPGSRHAKRWEDVAELVAAGLHVWATLNVQHLESLNDVVARMTGVRVAETLPDQVLDGADEIELIDVTPATLRDRLRAGQVYRGDTAARALEGFFKEGNLASLREVALRRAASHVDTDVRDWMRRSGVSGAWPSSERVLALIGPDGPGGAVVREAKRLADALHAPWAVLYVERAVSSAGAQAALTLAAQLGADVETQVSQDLVGAVLTAARARNATHIVLGRSARSRWRQWAGRSLAMGVMRRIPDVTVQVVPVHGTAARRPPPPPDPVWPWLGAAALLAALTGAGTLLGGVLPGEAMGMVYLAAVVGMASFAGLRVAMATAAGGFLAWDFFFLPPLYTVTIGSARDVVALVVFAAVALLSGSLAGRVRGEARAAQARIDGLRRIRAFSRKLGEAVSESDLLAEIARQAQSIAGRAVVLAPDGSSLDIRASAPSADTMDEGAWAAAHWSWGHAEPAGRGTSTLPGASWRFLPLQTVREKRGVLGVRSEAALAEPAQQALAALADQAAVAWERVILSQAAARGAAMEETQRLRTALLASLGHDLRTPLTGIQGAAGTLRTGWTRLEEATRADLLDSIEQDVGRMARFLSNITELTRLETGAVVARRERLAVAGIVEAAAARLGPGVPVGIHLPEPPPHAIGDAPLLEQALFNVLENAVKYAPPGSPVQIRVATAGSEVTVAVADEGVGIAPEDLPLVFDSFFRAGRGDRVAPGTGLGLAIARGLVEAMGGSVSAQSPRLDLPADGLPGTVVTFRIPKDAA